jgi:hypothetical protein
MCCRICLLLAYVSLTRPEKEVRIFMEILSVKNFDFTLCETVMVMSRHQCSMVSMLAVGSVRGRHKSAARLPSEGK